MEKKCLKVATLGCILILLTFLILPKANAQVGFAVGPKAGASINSFGGDAAGNVEADVSWVGGLFMNLSVMEAFSVQPELLIHQRGATQTVNNTQNKIKLSYFSVPVLLKLRVPIDGTFYPHILAGPSLSYRLNSSFTTTDTRDGQAVSFDAGNLRRAEYGAVLGGGVDMVSNRIFVNLDARYGFGLSDIGDGDNNLNIRNKNWTVMLGVGYRIGTEK